MKKILSVLFALLLMCQTAVPVFALFDPQTTPPANAVCEHEYWYVIEETADGHAFSYLRYIQDERIEERRSIYVPKSLGGITLTPENFTGSVFHPWRIFRLLPFEVDDDNEFFSVIDGVLYSKDGKTLVCLPPFGPKDTFFRIPEGTRGFANGPVESEWETTRCILFPDSVTDVPAQAFMYYNGAVAGKAGSAVQRFAEAAGRQFIALGEGHTHVYFSERVYDDDDKALTVEFTLVCPCGDVLDKQVRSYGYYRSPDNECKCLCHEIQAIYYENIPELLKSPRQTIRFLAFCVRRMFWQLLGVHQYCTCGSRHW